MKRKKDKSQKNSVENSYEYCTSVERACQIVNIQEWVGNKNFLRDRCLSVQLTKVFRQRIQNNSSYFTVFNDTFKTYQISNYKSPIIYDAFLNLAVVKVRDRRQEWPRYQSEMNIPFFANNISPTSRKPDRSVELLSKNG